MSEKNPKRVSDEARWICSHRVIGVSIEYVQTGTDTAETYLTLTPESGNKVRWLDRTFSKVATLELDHYRLVKPKYGVREEVEAWDKYEKANAAELAEYERLRAKYG